MCRINQMIYIQGYLRGSRLGWYLLVHVLVNAEIRNLVARVITFTFLPKTYLVAGLLSMASLISNTWSTIVMKLSWI